MRSDADQLGRMKGGKPGARADDRLIDTHQPAREGSGIFIRSQKVRDRYFCPGLTPTKAQYSLSGW
jgi:hypothetical protein